MFKGNKLFNCIFTYTKTITTIWLFTWVETILFSQVATIFNFGDTAAIQAINDNVIQIGTIICGFYFGKTMVENTAKGIEQYLLAKDTDTDMATTEEFEPQDSNALDKEPAVYNIDEEETL